jgi:hypothetical protein
MAGSSFQRGQNQEDEQQEESEDHRRRHAFPHLFSWNDMPE